MEFQDYLWKDVRDTHMKEGMLGATYSMKTVRGAINMLDYLPKAQARRLYQYSQGKEEEMLEYRRQRELEDKRAAAGGGITVNTASPVPQPVLQQVEIKEDPMEVLQKLKSLLDIGIISLEEFEIKKNEVISRM